MVKSDDDQSSNTEGREVAASSKGIYLTSLGVSVVVLALGFLSLDLYQRHNEGARSYTNASLGQAQKAEDVLPKLQPKAAQKAESKPVTQPKTVQQTAKPKPSKPLVSVVAKPVTSPKAEVSKPAEPQTPKPRFDIVRVETDGTAVIAGRATPGADVEVMSGKTSIGKVKSNTRGEWALVLEKPLKPGAHDLSIVASEPNSKVKQYSQQNVVVAVPQRRDEKPLVVLSHKDKPSQVLQLPEQPKRQTMPKGKLALNVVDYDTRGRIIFTGSGTPGATARIYVDNRFLRDAFVDKSGGWELRATTEIAPGNHDLRIDELDKTGKVTARIQLPFTRAQPVDVQAINKARNALKAEPVLTTPAQPTPPPEQVQIKPQAPAAKAPAVTAEKEKRTTLSTKPEQKITIARKEAAQPPAAPSAPAAPPVTAAPTVTVVPEIPKQAQSAPTPSQVPKLDTKPAPEPEQQIIAARKPIMRGGAFKELNVPAPQTPAPMVSTPEVSAQEAIAPPPEPKPQMQAAQQPAAPVQAPPVLSSGIIVQPGNNLWNISRVIYGQGAQYTVIYQANTDQIRDPDLIYPGQIFKTPGANPPRVIPPHRRKPLAK